MIYYRIPGLRSRRSVRQGSHPLGAISRLAILFNLIYFVGIADITSISISGGNLRWAWALLPILAVLAPTGKEDMPMLAASVALFVVHIVASLAAGTVIGGIFYSCWILFNYYFFFRAAYLITQKLGNRVWDAVLWGGRIQILGGVLLTIAGIDERARFIYFEPSYLAIGLVPYLFSVIFWSRRKLLDYSLLFALVAFNQSANMMLAILTALIFWLVCSKRLIISIVLCLTIPLTIYLVYLNALENTTDPNHGVASWVSTNGISVELVKVLLNRAGNRVPRIEAAVEVVGDNWLGGLGPGNYVDLTSRMNFDHITDGVSYYDPAGMPVINVLVEAVSNAGLTAASILVLVYLTLVRRALRIFNESERWIVLGSLITFGVMLQIESSYLRAYVWFAFGVFAARARSGGHRTAVPAI